MTHIIEENGTSKCGDAGPATDDPNVADCYKCWRYAAFEAQRERYDAEKKLKEEREQWAREVVAMGRHIPEKSEKLRQV